MSSKFIICLFVFGFVYLTNSAQLQTKPFEHPDYPGQCYDQEMNRPVAVGESTSDSKDCKWQRCQPDFSFVVSTCAPVGSPEGCTVTKPDFSKPYPKCCPQLICDEN